VSAKFGTARPSARVHPFHFVSLRCGEGAEGAAGGDVVLEVLDAGAADDGGGDRLAQGVPQQNGGPDATVQQPAPVHDLHGDNAEAARPRHRQHAADEIAANRVQRVDAGEHRVEGEGVERGEHDVRIMRAEADEPHQALVARLGHGGERAIGLGDLVKLIERVEVVDLDQVNMVGLEVGEALLDALPGAVACAVGGLGGQENLAAPVGHDLAVIGLARVVGGSGIAVGDAEVERPIDELDRLIVHPGRLQEYLPTEPQHGDPRPGSAEHPRGELAAVRIPPRSHPGRKRRAASDRAKGPLQETPPGHTCLVRVVHGCASLELHSSEKRIPRNGGG